MTMQSGSGKRGKPLPTAEVPEVEEALRKAEEYATLAAQALDTKQWDQLLRMERKWRGIADGWQVIANIDKPHGN